MAQRQRQEQEQVEVEFPPELVFQSSELVLDVLLQRLE